MFNNRNVMFKFIVRFFFSTILLFTPFITNAQRLAVKSNLLYDATSTINLGFEFATARNWTIELSANYNPWTFSDNKKMKLWMLQPELRWWTCQRFTGHFIGVHALGGAYNWGGMLPWGFRNGKMLGFIENKQIQNNRYQGWIIGTGVSYGYQFIVSNRLSFEASIGLGYARISYDRYACHKCGSYLGSGRQNYFGPTKIGLSIIYFIK